MLHRRLRPAIEELAGLDLDFSSPFPTGLLSLWERIEVRAPKVEGEIIKDHLPIEWAILT
jgi:hypothetical protein